MVTDGILSPTLTVMVISSSLNLRPVWITELVKVSRPPRPFLSPRPTGPAFGRPEDRLRPGPIAPPHERVTLGTSSIMRDKSDLLLAWVPAFAGMTTNVMDELRVDFQYIHRLSGERE